MEKNELFRNIPKVDVLLERESMAALIGRYGRALVTEAVREETDRLRRVIQTEDEAAAQRALEGLEKAVEDRLAAMCAPRVRKVINATGTILHTNLGRAPISREQAQRLTDIVTGYSNLEYDLENARRGERYAHFEGLLCRLTGAEAAMVVNNNAAAVLLVLSTLAAGGEVLVSRGELVEIGGKFRIPDVCRQSGAGLREVGTTNKTHFSDYEEAIGDETKALLKVHTSNYRIVGFTESVPASELAELAHSRGIPMIEDLGSGVLVDLEQYGLSHEPTVQESVRAGIDVVCFSGDKLLGGPQAGIIVGKKEYIARMKRHPLTRALRVDKFTVTALELVLLEYLRQETAAQNVPVLRMVSEKEPSVRARAEKLAALLRQRQLRADVAVTACQSQVGGGSLPLERLDSAAVTLDPWQMSADALERAMLALPVPIVPRVAEDKVLLDMRTVAEDELELTARMLGEVLA